STANAIARSAATRPSEPRERSSPPLPEERARSSSEASALVVQHVRSRGAERAPLAAYPPKRLVRKHLLPLSLGDVAPGGPARKALQRGAVERPFDGAYELADDQPAVGLE